MRQFPTTCSPQLIKTQRLNLNYLSTKNERKIIWNLKMTSNTFKKYKSNMKLILVIIIIFNKIRKTFSWLHSNNKISSSLIRKLSKKTTKIMPLALGSSNLALKFSKMGSWLSHIIELVKKTKWVYTLLIKRFNKSIKSM